MTTPIDRLKIIIRENRPNLSKNSITTYASLLKSIYLTNHREVDSGMSLEWFEDPNNIIDAVRYKPTNTRKSLISALTVLIKPENVAPELTKMMMDDAAAVQKQYDSQQMTEKQKENWVPFQKVREVEKKLYDIVKYWLDRKLPLDPDQMRILTDWLLIALSSGIYFPPRRSEWASIKLKDINPETDNYIDLKKGVFVLNQYKTAKLYGREEIEYGKVFDSLLKKYLALVPEQIFLFENKSKPYTASYITFKLNRIFNRNVSTSMLRHIWTSHKYGDSIPQLDELKTNARAMGHSVVKHLEYAVR